ncbi:MAG: acyltransferase [Caulobacter sp.]|nr:acyltransferase [Caulobacter sp.]
MLLNIQVLRALAAYLVVFVHLEGLFVLAGAGKGATLAGNGGVHIFFVISGLLMVATTRRPGQTASGFFRARLARVAPLYWLVTLAVFALALVAPGLFQSTTADLTHLAKSLAFIPYRRPDGIMDPVVFVGWTLNYEMAFYALFALGMMLPNRRVALTLTFGVLIAAVAIGLALHPRAPLAGFYTASIQLEFVAGMALALVLDRLPGSATWRRLCIPLGVAALIAMLLGPMLWPRLDLSLMFGPPAVLIVFSALVAEKTGLVAGQAWLQRLGAASYSIYLTHYFCTQAVIKLCERFNPFGAPGVIAFGALALLLVAAVGLTVHYLVERPLSSVARRWLSGPASGRTLRAAQSLP